MSWEIAVIVGLGYLPFFIDNTAITINRQEYTFFTRIFGLSVLGYILHLCKKIAELNDATISQIVNQIFNAYIIVAFILFIYFIYVGLDDSFGKGKKKE